MIVVLSPAKSLDFVTPPVVSSYTLPDFLAESQLLIDRLRDYLELMAVRMGPRLTYQLDLPDALRTVPVPALLLQPLLENAIRHGLEPQLAGGHIAVQARTVSGATGPCLQLQVDDTGVGLSAGVPGTAHGFGLTQVRERLATLYGTQSALELIAASAGGVSARVTFPLESGPSA